MESGFAQAAQIFKSPERPSAICAGNDLLAIAAAAAASERGLRVPEDISIVGYDDIAYARLVSPSLTTVRQPGPAMGEAAAQLLLERLIGTRTEDRTLVLRPELIVRQSTRTAQQ
jgi:DNA-binding LacI/PurR family transcriptional regulator